MNVTLRWTDRDDALLVEMHGRMPLADIAEKMGRSRCSLRARVTRLGLAKRDLWTPEEERLVMEAYAAVGKDGVIHLAPLAEALGRNKGNIVRKAKSLGVETNMCRPFSGRRAEPRPKMAEEDRKRLMSERMKERHRTRGHHMLGKTHTPEARRAISNASKKRWAEMSDEERQDFIDKVVFGAVAAGSFGAPNVRRGSWMAGWREIGGKRNFYRSRWEANYARYLEWLKSRGEISEWAHEPEVFWFHAIKRGVRSYKPDFRVWERDGSSALHEVKGWMDSRSKTTLKRMAKYYPEEKLILIDGPQYRSIRIKAMGLVPGWEDAKA